MLNAIIIVVAVVLGGYLAVAVALTWETDVNQIIAYSSRAFAFYYALQCVGASIPYPQSLANLPETCVES